MKKLSIVLLAVVYILYLGCKTDSKPKLQGSDPSVNNSDLLEAGKEISSSVFLVLSSELQKAMKSGGVDHAISYCNINAMDITDSLSSKYNAEIKRTSLKFRNPNNRPSPTEISLLHQLENKKKRGIEILPQIVMDGNSKVFYAPIIVQDMCLKCHGQESEIDNYAIIKELYPNDLATAYQQGDLRGMWSISFRD
jgi:hypothetical protein